MNGKPWSLEEDRYMRDHYPHDDTNEICRVLKRSKLSVYMRAKGLGLKKTEEAKRKYGCYLTGKEGVGYQFQKGNIPYNKGKKMPDHVYEKAKATMFKKGQIPFNHKPVGTITERASHSNRWNFLYIKIGEPNKWKELHRYLWEKKKGPIPEDKILVFKDGDNHNCSLENLELITREENMRRNSIHNRYPEDLKRAILLLGALKRKINENESHNRRTEKSPV